MTKEMDEAIVLLERAARAKPEDLAIRRKLTRALAKAGRYHEAVSSVLGAVAVHPEWTQHHFDLIATLTNDGFGHEVHAAATKLAARRPRDAAVWYVLGMSCQTIGEQHEAIVSYRKGLKHAPTNAAILNNLGNALKITGDEKACIENQRKAIAHSSTIAEPHYVLGVLSMKAGKRDDAKEHFESFLRLGQSYLDEYLQHARASLHILSGALQERAERSEKRSPYWQCPKCGAVFKKSEAGMMAKMVIGTATCGNCNAKYDQIDVYGGRYDVEIA